MVALAGTKTAPDTWRFDISGAVAATVTMDYGDGTVPVSLPVVAGAATVTHQYLAAGQHTYTATVTDTVTAVAATLTDLAAKAATLDALHTYMQPYGGTLNDISRTTAKASLTVTVNVGAATIYAQVMPAEPLPYVLVSGWIADTVGITSWQIWRAAAGDRVLVAEGAAPQAAFSIEDHLAPVQVPITYELVIRKTSGGTLTQTTFTSNEVMLTGTRGCYLTDPYSGATVTVTLASWPERARQARQAVLSVISRPDPVVLSDVHTWASGTWTFLTGTDGQLDALLDVLQGHGIVYLRTQPGSSIASVYAAAGTISETRYSRSGADQRRMVAVDIQEIAPIPYAGLPSRSNLAGLATLATTLEELSRVRETLLQLSLIPVSA